MSNLIGVITGTGFYNFLGDQSQGENISTPYGEVFIEQGEFSGHQVAFIARHGKTHEIPPSDINYRANIYALHMLGAKAILATNVSGSLLWEWPAPTLVLIDQFLNFTSCRKDTFFPIDGKVRSLDMTDPYSPTLQEVIRKTAAEASIPIHDGGVYACFNGPRLECRAEIEMVRRNGGNLIGHTGYPEVVLANELSIQYASIAIVSNYAAGMKPNINPLSIRSMVREIGDTVTLLIKRTVKNISNDIANDRLES